MKVAITSFLAFMKVEKPRAKHNPTILQTLQAYGALTALEIAEKSKLSHTQVSRRMKELMKRDKVEPVGIKSYKGYRRTVYSTTAL